MDIGANGRIDTAQQPVVGFVMNNGGLMAGVSLAGTTAAVGPLGPTRRVVVDIGANRINTQQPVVGFVMNNGGLMAGVSLAGTKISKIEIDGL